MSPTLVGLDRSAQALGVLAEIARRPTKSELYRVGGLDDPASLTFAHHTDEGAVMTVSVNGEFPQELNWSSSFDFDGEKWVPINILAMPYVVSFVGKLVGAEEIDLDGEAKLFYETLTSQKLTRDETGLLKDDKPFVVEHSFHGMTVTHDGKTTTYSNRFDEADYDRLLSKKSAEEGPSTKPLSTFEKLAARDIDVTPSFDEEYEQHCLNTLLEVDTNAREIRRGIETEPNFDFNWQKFIDELRFVRSRKAILAPQGLDTTGVDNQEKSLVESFYSAWGRKMFDERVAAELAKV